MLGAVRIERAAAIKASADGVLDDASLIKDRRSKKAGALSNKARMVLEASRRCLPEQSLGDRAGVSLGTLYGSIDVAELCLRTVRERGFAGVTPSWYAAGLPNAISAIVASVHDMKGPNFTVLGYQAGIEAIVIACRQIALGRAAAMLAGGFDWASAYYTDQLCGAAGLGEASAIHPAVGLVWLTRHAGSKPADAIVGWSHGVADRASALDSALISRLIESAAKGQALRGMPIVHLVHPGRKGSVDHLAASGPVHLVDDIVAAGAPGVHALVAAGFAGSVVCLLVEKASA